MEVANGQEAVWVNRNDIVEYNTYTNLSCDVAGYDVSRSSYKELFQTTIIRN